MGLFLLALGGLVGMAIERIHFGPERAATLKHLEEVLEQSPPP